METLISLSSNRKFQNGLLRAMKFVSFVSFIASNDVGWLLGEGNADVANRGGRMRDAITMHPSEESEIRELDRMLKLGTPALVGPADERIDLPESVYHLLKDIVANMMRGKTIVLTPQTNKLTTQAAADFLGFSRPHLVKLLEAGAIPFERVGQHRRILMKDILTYQKHRDLERRRALNDLAKAEFGEGSYEGTEIPEGGTDE